MTKHDTWAFLKKPNPYDAIERAFPRGFPMRDPFPMSIAEGREIALWIIDIDRLTPQQTYQIAIVIAQGCGANIDDVMDDAIAKKGFAISNEWIGNMEVGSEGYARTMELKEFLEAYPPAPLTPELKQAYREFVTSQVERWIDGDEIPPTLPATLDEVDPNLRTPELAAAIQQNRINQALAGGNYSVLDVLMGKAMVDILNEFDPDNSYSLVDDEKYF